MYARVTRTRITPGTIDDAAAWFEESVLTRAESQSGFVGAFDLYDRESGAGITITLWETAEARAASEEMAAGMRDEAGSTLAAEIVAVERYEVLAHRLQAPTG